MASAHPDLDQEVSSMTVDQLKDVLDDVVNHQKPESEKCSLVRRLKEEASKDEKWSLEPQDHFLDSGNNSKRKSRGFPPRTGTAQSLGRSSGQASNSSSQSLQDLASEHGPNTSSSNSFKSCGSRKLNTRANSFSLASNTVCLPKAPEFSQTRSSSASGTWTNKKSNATTNNNNNGNISTRTLSSSAASSSFNDFSDALTPNSSSHVDVNDKNNNNDCDREVEGEVSARHASSCNSSLKTYSHHSMCEDTQNQSQSSFGDDQMVNSIEMQDLRRRAQYVQYNSNAIDGSVDSMVQFTGLTTREPEDAQFARRIQLDSNDGQNASLDHRDRQIIRPYPLDDPSPVPKSVNPPPNTVNKLNKKKAKPDERKVLAEHIEGYIGDKDVEFLVHYVGGSDSSKATNSKVPASAPGNSKKKPVNGKEPRKRTVTDGGITNGCLEEESREGSPAEDSSNARKFNKYPFTKSESLDSPAVSPSQAPSIASCVEYGREFSDDEMGYHSDREAGFVPYTRRRKVRGQSQKILHTASKARSVGNSSFASAASSPLSNTPSVISASSMSAQGTSGTTCRGYESEREYCAEDRKQLTRRKVVSSMPHSEQNSPENSDVDSSISLPVAAHRMESAQKVSYAEMAASSNINSKLPSDIALEVNQIPVEDICISSKHSQTGHDDPINFNTTNCDLKPAASNPASHSIKPSHKDLPQQQQQTSSSSVPHQSTLSKETVPNDGPIIGGNDVAADLPPVVMFGEAKEVEGVPEPSSASFTFGFFDDIPAPALSTTNSAPKPPTKVDNKISSSPREVKRKMVYKASGPDIDTNSFNYNEILFYIHNAWETAARSFKSLNKKGSGTDTSES